MFFIVRSLPHSPPPPSPLPPTASFRRFPPTSPRRVCTGTDHGIHRPSGQGRGPGLSGQSLCARPLSLPARQLSCHGSGSARPRSVDQNKQGGGERCHAHRTPVLHWLAARAAWCTLGEQGVFVAVLLYVHRNLQGLLGTRNPGRPPRLFHTALGLWILQFNVALRPQKAQVSK